MVVVHPLTHIGVLAMVGRRAAYGYGRAKTLMGDVSVTLSVKGWYAERTQGLDDERSAAPSRGV